MNNSTMQLNSRFDAAGNLQAGTVLLTAATITGDEVFNLQNEHLGKIQEIMLDITEGKIRYAVLSSGGFMGMGDNLFAVPWRALILDKENHRFLLDLNLDRLKKVPGFDKDHWPNMADPTWKVIIDSYFIR